MYLILWPCEEALPHAVHMHPCHLYLYLVQSTIQQVLTCCRSAEAFSREKRHEPNGAALWASQLAAASGASRLQLHTIDIRHPVPGLAIASVQGLFFFFPFET